MDDLPYSNILSIRRRGKPIPYGGVGEVREDGHANYGFRDLKGDQEAHAHVPELQSDVALSRLVQSINLPHTGLFTVGCVSGHVDENHGFRDQGYVEFGINSMASIADARNYFSVFFHFDDGLKQTGFSGRFAFEWQLEGATFIEREGVAGFTCTVFLNSHFHASRAEANQAWSTALELLGGYLQSVPPMGPDKLFG